MDRRLSNWRNNSHTRRRTPIRCSSARWRRLTRKRADTQTLLRQPKPHNAWHWCRTMRRRLEHCSSSLRATGQTSHSAFHRLQPLKNLRPRNSVSQMSPSPEPARIQDASMRRTIWILTALLAALTLAVFGQTIGFGFVNFDDVYYVYENPVVTNGLTLHGVC